MGKFKIKNSELSEDVSAKIEFPKYTTQIMNLANQNSQGTRPKVVGQLSELIVTSRAKTYSEWKKWYLENMPDAIDNATEKIFAMIPNMKTAFSNIDKPLVRRWVEDLVLTKTFIGLCFQESILKRVAKLKSTTYRRSNPNEESKGIDGYIGKVAVSIKPITYKTKPMLSERIDAELIFYEKKKNGITISFDF